MDDTGAEGGSAPLDLPARIRALARSAFGWESLRPGQGEAIEAAVAGRDVLAVLPTGFGKSAIYQLAGMLVEGVTLVISPLISLQEDQVARIGDAPGAPRAVALNSTRTDRELIDAWVGLEGGEIEFAFVSPEQLANPAVLARLKRLRPRLVVVDEAHCVASWGHDFRPDYLGLGDVIDGMPGATTIALTATGSPPVRQEIIDSLHLDSPLLVARGFDRPNIRLEVERCESDAVKRATVVDRILALPGPGLLYVATRADTDKYAAALAKRGLRAAAYSGSLGAAARTAVHEAFTDGALDVVVATSAFGMGIDKPDVRFVVHASVTDSVDDYYQEIGRGGRDGGAALALLYYRMEDLALRRFFAGRAPDPADVRAVVDRLHLAPSVARADLARDVDMPARRLASLVALLEESGMLRGTVRTLRLSRRPDAQAIVDAAMQVSEQRERIEQSRIEMMRGFAESPGCRRRYLLGYFGEERAEDCDNCDVCTDEANDARFERRPEDRLPAAAGAAAPRAFAGAVYPLESRVRHPLWGDGVVMRHETDRMTVYFDDEGYKTLSLHAVEARHLLARID